MDDYLDVDLLGPLHDDTSPMDCTTLMQTLDLVTKDVEHTRAILLPGRRTDLLGSMLDKLMEIRELTKQVAKADES